MDLLALSEFRRERLESLRPTLKKGGLDQYIDKTESGCWFLKKGTPNMPKLSSCYRSYKTLLYEYAKQPLGIYDTLKPGCGSRKCINPAHMIQCKYHETKNKKDSAQRAQQKRDALKSQLYIDNELIDKIRALHNSRRIVFYIEIAIEEYLNRHSKQKKSLWQRITGK